MPDNCQTDQNRAPLKKDYSGYILGGIGLVGLAVLAIAGILCFKLVGPDMEYGTLAILILVGIAAFLLLMNLLSFSAGQLGILTHGQAFGLPDGSVRAILTMAFIVLIGVIGSYLVTRPASTPYAKEYVTLATCVLFDQANEVKRQVTGTDVLVVLTPCNRTGGGAAPSGAAAGASAAAAGGGPPAGPGAGGAAGAAGPGGGGGAVAGGAGAPTYDVRLYPRLDTRFSEETAKQILTMLSTIVTAMIGFYFGSKQGSDDADRVNGKPTTSGPADRVAAAKTIDEQLANAPDAEELQRRAAQLISGGKLAASETDEVKKLQDELPGLKKTLAAARAARAADATTPAQMQGFAQDVKNAVTRLQFIQRHLTDLANTSGVTFGANPG
ncbi:MAG: hypothetical protein QOC72_3482 [Methylobacteriaceae bacterium]|jgi:hypothetical protein|nr:hypothetical protein [Methylobacteriaceae bacterium]